MSLFCYNCYAVNITGQVPGNLIDELLAKGARDVSIIPATMKKGRSGSIIQAIAKPEDSEALARKMIEETGSLGIRVNTCEAQADSREEDG